MVSIHAPTQGATTTITGNVAANGFNPRAHAGRDTRSFEINHLNLFQSTRPRRARLFTAPIWTD